MPTDFDRRFQALTGEPPFPWQTALYKPPALPVSARTLLDRTADTGERLRTGPRSSTRARPRLLRKFQGHAPGVHIATALEAADGIRSRTVQA